MYDENEFLVTCEKGHSTEIDIDTLQEWLEGQSCQCGGEIVGVEPDGLQVECVHCLWEESCSWQDAMMWLWCACPRCGSNTETDGDLQIVGTQLYELGVYEGFCPAVDSRPYRRKGRPDYWEIVVHYTTREHFLAIFGQEKIEASPTGLFGRPAVCLTEAPVTFSSDLKSRFGPFGIAFRKSDILKAGGGPALYLPDRLIQSQKQTGSFARELKPFINVLRIPATAPAQTGAKRVDFLYEREWRFPGDIEFGVVSPLGVVLPESTVFEKFAGSSWPDLLKIAWKFKEIS